MDASVTSSLPTQLPLPYALSDMPIKSWQGDLIIGVPCGTATQFCACFHPSPKLKDSSEKSRRPPPTESAFAVRADWDMKRNQCMMHQEGFWKTSMPVMRS
ncbi:hypothetical protein FLAG1_02483 [Fusarium langsethiae]|uniref:Uncharacterized protein n=1 Tax=Fusarium langsethiae TaxID=179993 RepID=A0A0M9F2E9_FUSLA|nr:hypothetical protein FLAG1_02483 [Fusarium langsethiae]GKU00363.1 unnamed protein product [Fusarium langsethiae]GKU17551.1 unnamed protein product [Fusarium langsethiae]